MNVSWGFLIGGLVLLFLPTQRLLPKGVVFRVLEQTPPRGRGRFPWWWTSAVWLEPVLGFAGAWLLRNFSFEAVPVPEPRFPGQDVPSGLTMALPVLLCYAAIGVAVISHLPVWKDRRACIAPLGFMAGALFGLLPVNVAAIALVIAACGLGGFRHFGATFLLGAPALAAAGLLFKMPKIEVGLAAVLMLLPFVFSVATYRVITFPSRR